MNTDGVLGVITLITERITGKFGRYITHIPNGRNGYDVYLTNGKIIIPKRVAENYEKLPSSVTHEELQDIAKSFVPDR